jgi:hypothetical protein
MNKAELRCWVARLEEALFPFQESEEEQESFTPVGRKRAESVLCEFAEALRRKHA